MNLGAKPEAITLEAARTAVIVVDMQNDFGSKGGMSDRAGIGISCIQTAFCPTAKVLVAARRSPGSFTARTGETRGPAEHSNVRPGSSPVKGESAT